MRLPTTTYRHGYGQDRRGNNTRVRSHCFTAHPVMGGETRHYTYLTAHCSPSITLEEDKTKPALRDIGDSALSIRPRPGLDPAPTLDLVQRTVWHDALGHFAILSPTTSGCPGMASHSQGTSLQSTQQESIRHHLKAPRRLGLPSPYKRAGQGSTERGTKTERKT
jgi:hypothetical protein